MTFADRVAALEWLGLTPRQTRFVATVALHSGYCLRRQYAAFSRTACGKNAGDFLEALVERGVAARTRYELNRGHVYHLRSKAIYEAIEQDENRNRRCAGPALVARKLMLLDFAISRPEVEWFATEQDKVALFLTRYRIPEAHLPHRVYQSADRDVAPTTRYFVHKQPIYVAGEPPVIHFVFGVPERTGDTFKQFLWDHAGLLSRVPAWAVVAVCSERQAGLEACARIFAKFVGGALRPAAGRGDELGWYFGMRRAVDARDRSALSVSKIERFHQARRRFSGPAFERLYVEWLAQGDAVLERTREQHVATTRMTGGRLITHELPFSYSQFGALSGVA
jgi:hypothetical protein